jgi:threonine dehydratase
MVPDLDVLLVPASGGGLIAGCASAAKRVRPKIEVYGVEPATADDIRQSLRKGERVAIEVPKTIADGLQVPSPGELTFPIIQETVKDVLVVTDDEMIETLTWMLERMKVLVEPSGVVGAAAVRHGKADFAGKKVGVILSGGNLDRSRLADFLSRTA